MAWSLVMGSALQVAALGAPQASSRADPPGRADYDIAARVDDPDKRLEGQLTLRWTNTAPVATNELWFHLYWNAFANNRSTHLIESGGKLRGKGIERDWGWQRVTSISLDGRDLRLGSWGLLVQYHGNPGGRRLGRERGRQAAGQDADAEQHALQSAP